MSLVVRYFAYVPSFWWIHASFLAIVSMLSVKISQNLNQVSRFFSQRFWSVVSLTGLATTQVCTRALHASYQVFLLGIIQRYCLWSNQPFYLISVLFLPLWLRPPKPEFQYEPGEMVELISHFILFVVFVLWRISNLTFIQFLYWDRVNNIFEGTCS